MTQLICWSLNQASQLIDQHKTEIEAIFTRQNISLEWGKNTSFHNWPDNKRPSNYPNHRLMFEPSGFALNVPEEYFAPIALKCLGAYPSRQDTLFESADQSRLNKIISQNNPFNTDIDPAGYWSEQPIQVNPIQQMQMKTRLKRGYYQLLYDYLQLEKHKGVEKKHLLIGYSQGGLVARYLQYLDTHVFKKHMIAGVITIGSPNWGAPVANPSNLEQMNQVLVKLKSTYLTWIDALANKMPWWEHDFPPLDSLTDLAKLAQYCDATLLAAVENKFANQDYLGQLLSLRKWLSGVVPFATAEHHSLPTAFNDMSFGNFALPYSVLSLVNESDPYHAASQSGFTGAVIHTDCHFLTDIANLMPESTHSDLRLDTLYRELMQESASAEAAFSAQKERYEWVQSALQASRKNLGKAADAHDFIIPSAYQSLPEDSAGFLGNHIVSAHHGNGMLKSWPQVQTLLKELAQRLSN